MGSELGPALRAQHRQVEDKGIAGERCGYKSPGQGRQLGAPLALYYLEGEVTTTMTAAMAKPQHCRR